MTRFFCDRCDKDVTDDGTGAIHGIADADGSGNGTNTDCHDHVCGDCYRAWLVFMEGGVDQCNEAVSLLRGMVGLVQLVQDRYPDLLANHRYVDAMAWLAEREPAAVQS